MPTPAFLDKAKQPNRQGRLLLSVETENDQEVYYGAEEDWLDPVDSSRISADHIPGSITNRRGIGAGKREAWYRKWKYDVSYAIGAQPYNVWLRETTWQFLGGKDRKHAGFVVIALYEEAAYAPFWRMDINDPALKVTESAPAYIDTRNGIVPQTFHFPEGARLEQGKSYRMTAYIYDPNTGLRGGFWWHTKYTKPLDISTVFPDSMFKTQVIDFGQVPPTVPLLGGDWFVPTTGELTVTAYGGNSPSSLASLGVVLRGDPIGAQPYRYYQFLLNFASGGREYVRIEEIRVTASSATADHYGTHIADPIADLLPVLPADALRTLGHRIDLKKMPTVGEINVKCLWTREVGARLYSQSMRNKAVSLRWGFAGLPFSDYEQIFAGTWHDYSLDAQNGAITFKIQDTLKKFQKLEIPRKFSREGVKNTTARTWIAENIIDVLLEVISEAVTERFLDRRAFEDLRDAYYLSAAWKVSRNIPADKPVKLNKLVEELCTLAGIFLTPLPNGKLFPIRYDPDAEPVAVLDARTADFGSINGALDGISTRQYVYYDALKDDAGDNPEDYGSGYALVAGDLEIAWGEESEQSYYDKWLLGRAGGTTDNTGHVALAQRWASWFATPRMKCSVDAIPLQHIGVLPGQVIAVDGLQLPCALEDWPGLTVGKKFLVVSKTLDIRKAALKWEIVEI